MSKVKRNWILEQQHDLYVKKAKIEGHRARSFYKLKEIVDRYKLIKPGMIILDLGAAPGSWSQLALKMTGSKGRVLALDILPITPIVGVEFIQGDFTDRTLRRKLARKFSGQNKIDLILSDMAPNLTGIRVIDEANILRLAEEVLKFAKKTMQPQGVLFIKSFYGANFSSFFKKIREQFLVVKTVKPKASRNRSKEVFLLAKELKCY